MVKDRLRLIHDIRTMNIQIKRIYDKPTPNAGLRILVDRLWPRGLSKEAAQIDVWLKEIAPSNELRRWYQHDEEKWPAFKQKYFAELDTNKDAVDTLLGYIKEGDVVLLFSSKELKYNNAMALKEYVVSRYS